LLARIRCNCRERSQTEGEYVIRKIDTSTAIRWSQRTTTFRSLACANDCRLFSQTQKTPSDRRRTAQAKGSAATGSRRRADDPLAEHLSAVYTNSRPCRGFSKQLGQATTDLLHSALLLPCCSFFKDLARQFPLHPLFRLLIFSNRSLSLVHTLAFVVVSTTAIASVFYSRFLLILSWITHVRPFLIKTSSFLKHKGHDEG
jgi:hypothetical protein